MAQKKENFRHSGEFNVYIPKNSTTITSGDVVVMPRRCSPRSRAYFGALGRISPISSVGHAPFVVGVADSDFSSTTVGATLYAAPTSNQAISAYKRGTFALAITDTSGNAGDLVKYSSGASGVQLFTIDKGSRSGLAIGKLTKTFSGATANDTQFVELIPKDDGATDLSWWLENRAIEGCYLQKHSVNGQASSQIQCGATIATGAAAHHLGQHNYVIIQGKRFRLTRKTDLTLGPNTAATASRCRMVMVVARSGGFAARTCTSVAVSMAEWSATAVTGGFFVPKTMTSGEVVVGYAVRFSATAISYKASRLHSLVGSRSDIPRFGNWSV